MPRIGAHVSSSDGYVEAVKREVAVGGNCGQFYLRDSKRWDVGDVDGAEADRFRAAIREKGIEPWVVHGADRIDLATPERDLGRRSVRDAQAELAVADALGAAYYVLAPGDHVGASRAVGVANAVRRLSAIDHDGDVTVLLENTAGRGSTLGRSVEELAAILERSTKDAGDVGLCLDTCSLHAAGHDVATPDGLTAVLDAVESTVGIECLSCLHLNDSAHSLGSHRDQHAPLGEGEIGEAGFELVTNHEWLRRLPMVVESPDIGRAARDVERLRGLVGATSDRGGPRP